MREESMQLWSVQRLIEWLRVREQGGKSFPHSVDNLINLLSNSALFKRLLDGKEPFKEAPPLSFDHPWYDLLEQGRGETADVYEADQWERKIFGWDTLMVNQYPWKIIRKISDAEYIITYGNGMKYYKICNRGDNQWFIETSSKLCLLKSIAES